MEFKASKVEDAIRAGLKELGLTEDEAEITVIEHGGFLKKARVDVTKKIVAEPIEAIIAEAEKAEEEAEAPSAAPEKEEIVLPLSKETEKAIAFVRGMAEHMSVECEITAVEHPDSVDINITGKDTGALIGYRGDVLDSIQFLASLILNEKGGKYKRLHLNCENYREKREEILKGLAAKLADKAVRTGRRVRLEPMNPAERRIIHAALQGNKEVDTSSEGEDPRRYVVITPKRLKKQNGGKRDSERRGGERRDGERREGGYNRGRNGGRRDDRRDNRGGGSRSSSKSKPFSLGFGSYLGKSPSYLDPVDSDENKD